MNEYEKKLQSFRKQRKKEQFLNQCKTYLWHRPLSSLSSLIPSGTPIETKDSDNTNTANSAVPLIEIDDSSSDDETQSFKSLETVKDYTDEVEAEEPFNWIKLTASVLIWICLFSYSVYIEFGAIFFIFSCFYVIWTNTRTRLRKPNEVSAYSVFNPNCEPIEGTLDAKKLESEMIYGMMF